MRTPLSSLTRTFFSMKSISGFIFFAMLPRRFLTTLLFLFAIFILLLLLTSSRSTTPPPPVGAGVGVGVGVDVVIHNSTLLRLASTNPFFASETAEIESLLSCHDFGTHHRTLFHSSWRSLFHSSLRLWSSRRHLPPSLLLPPIHHFTSKSSSCAVVGNSGILLSKSYGSLIDSHDLVIRLNNARIRGFEPHVGSKTSISFVNSNILHLCSRHDHCFCHPYGPDTPIVMYICQPVHFVDLVLCNASHTVPLMVTDPRFDRLCASIVKYYSLKRFGGNVEEWGRLRDERSFHYSSGMQAVMLALGLCDKVSLFGFGKEVGVNHHYHTNQKAELGLHDYDAEYEFYRDLVHRPHAIPFKIQIELPPVVIYR